MRETESERGKRERREKEREEREVREGERRERGKRVMYCITCNKYLQFFLCRCVPSGKLTLGTCLPDPYVTKSVIIITCNKQNK
jgi:hypothetical protein